MSACKKKSTTYSVCRALFVFLILLNTWAVMVISYLCFSETPNIDLLDLFFSWIRGVDIAIITVMGGYVGGNKLRQTAYNWKQAPPPTPPTEEKELG